LHSSSTPGQHGLAKRFPLIQRPPSCAGRGGNLGAGAGANQKRKSNQASAVSSSIDIPVSPCAIIVARAVPPTARSCSTGARSIPPTRRSVPFSLARPCSGEVRRTVRGDFMSESLAYPSDGLGEVDQPTRPQGNMAQAGSGYLGDRLGQAGTQRQRSKTPYTSGQSGSIGLCRARLAGAASPRAAVPCRIMFSIRPLNVNPASVLWRNPDSVLPCGCQRPAPFAGLTRIISWLDACSLSPG
jgi:hypothetical protein